MSPRSAAFAVEHPGSPEAGRLETRQPLAHSGVPRSVSARVQKPCSRDLNELSAKRRALLGSVGKGAEQHLEVAEIGVLLRVEYAGKRRSCRIQLPLGGVDGLLYPFSHPVDPAVKHRPSSSSFGTVRGEVHLHGDGRVLHDHREGIVGGCAQHDHRRHSQGLILTCARCPTASIRTGALRNRPSRKSACGPCPVGARRAIRETSKRGLLRDGRRVSDFVPDPHPARKGLLLRPGRASQIVPWNLPRMNGHPALRGVSPPEEGGSRDLARW